MASRVHRAWCPTLAGSLVLGLTPGLASAAPPDPDPDPAVVPEQSEARADPATEAGDAGDPEGSSVAPAIVVGSVALASLTTAIVFTTRSTLASRSLADDLDAGVQYDQDDRRLHVGRRDAIVAASMYGVTAAVGALLLVCVLRPAARVERRHSLAASVGPRGGALVWTVGF